MRTIHIATNTDERCGNAEYARDLAEQLRKYYDVTLGLVPTAVTDVMILNWHPAVVPVSIASVKQMQAMGTKVVLLHQNSTEHGEAELFRVCDAVVAHEPMTGDKVTYLPHPVPAVPVGMLARKIHTRIGTAGFPFPWKRMDVAAEAAKRTGCEFLAFAPTYEKVNTSEEINKIYRKGIRRAVVHESWVPTADVVQALSSCLLNIFWFQSQSIEDTLGQTGSARLGVAARRPMIISRHRKFRTMIEEYGDEFYIADTEEEVYEMAADIIEMEAYEGAVRPVMICAETNWFAVGLKYRDLIEGLFDAERNSAAELRIQA